MTALLLICWALAGQVEAPAGDAAANSAAANNAAVESGADERGAEVRRLVRQLDAAELKTRTRAEEQLIGLGVGVLDLLPKADHGSAELQQRLARIRQTLEKKSADDSALAATVTLAGEMTLSQAIAEVEKQTGNKIVDLRKKFGQVANDPTVTTDFEKMPFWQAVDLLFDRAEMAVNNYATEPGLAMVARGEQQLPRAPRAAYAGPLRLEATKIFVERTPAIADSSSLRVALEIAWEPRLRPILFQQSLASLKATDDEGHEIKPVHEEGELEAGGMKRSTATEIELPFIAPPRSAKSIASLKGSLSALLPGPIELFEFDNLTAAALPDAKPVEKKHAGATVTLDGIRKNNEIWEVRLRIRFDSAANALESHRTWIFDNEAYMVDADKKRIDNGGYETTHRDENEVGVAYLFEHPVNLEGCTFVYKSPSSLHVVPVEFEIKNLELP